MWEAEMTQHSPGKGQTPFTALGTPGYEHIKPWGPQHLCHILGTRVAPSPGELAMVLLWPDSDIRLFFVSSLFPKKLVNSLEESTSVFLTQVCSSILHPQPTALLF